jgi:hypothetical protein
MRRAAILGGLLAAMTLAVGACSLAVMRPWESRPEYLLRSLRSHGRESKNLVAQEACGDELVALGAESVDVLVEEVARGAGTGYGCRYSPTPVEMLTRIGPPAQERMAVELSRTILADERYLELGIGYLLAFDDWKYAEEWAEALAKSPTGRFDQYHNQIFVAARHRGYQPSAAGLSVGDQDARTLPPELLEFIRAQARAAAR